MSDISGSSSDDTYRSWVDRMLEVFRADPDRVVLRTRSRELSGGEFAGLVCRYARALTVRGLGPGDRVALLATESPEALAVRYAIALVGAASVFTPDTGRAERLVQFLKQVRPRLLVVFPETAPDAQAAAARVLSDETVSVGPVDGLADLATEAAAESDEPFPGRARAGDLAVLIASGGTTGTSKASMRSFEAYAALLDGPADPERKLLTCSAFAYVTQVMVAQTLLNGGSVTLRDRFDAAELLRVIEDERITMLSLVEPLLGAFADHPDLAARDVSSLRRVSHIGAAAPASFRRRLLERLGPVLVNTYGASEAGMVSVIAAPEYGLDHPELLSSAGRPRPGVELRIVTLDGTDVPAGEPGVIVVRLPGMSSGYIGRPDDPAYRDGWYTTGDLGYLDDDGYLHVRGRAADARVVDGDAVMPLDLEDAAGAHTDVVYAVALPTDPGVEGAFGVLALRSHGTPLTADVLADHLRGLVAPAAVGPVVVVDHLPVTEQGKPDRAIVAELLRP
ncbi:MAG TPA: AMP-binding protein [Lapillicoccus sp.]|nr:AMP-binding protein [Lapillicoccus sp.]